MTQVTAQMSISLDGYYTGPVDNRDPKDMTGWMQGPEAPGFFRVTRWVIDAMGGHAAPCNVLPADAVPWGSRRPGLGPGPRALVMSPTDHNR